MIARLRVTIVKEMLSFMRDPHTRQLLLVSPILQVIIFSFAATMEVRNIDIAVIDDDGGRWSRELLARIEVAEFVGELHRIQSTGQLADLVERREALLGIHIMPDFSRRIAQGEMATVQLLVDGRRANAGQVAASYLTTISNELGAEIYQQATGSIAMPSVALRNWFNPNLIYRWFIVPSLGATLSMLIALMMTSLSIARERELGTFDQLLVSPSTPFEIILGKTLPAFIAGYFISCVVMAMAIFLFKVPFHGSLLLLFGSQSVFILSVVGIGMSISSVCQTQQQAILGLFIAMMPIMLISGFVTPVENMPQWLQYVAELSPLKHFLIIVQGSYLKALSPMDVFHSLWPLAAIAAVTLGIATLVIRRRMH